MSNSWHKLKRSKLHQQMQMLHAYRNITGSKVSHYYPIYHCYNFPLHFHMTSCTSFTKIFSKILSPFGQACSKASTKALGLTSSIPRCGKPSGLHLLQQAPLCLEPSELDLGMSQMTRLHVLQTCGHSGCYTSVPSCSIVNSEGRYTTITSSSW